MSQTKLNDTQITPAGNDTQIQFNDGDAFNGDASLTWDKTNKMLELGGANWYSGGGSAPDGIHVTKEGGGVFTTVLLGHSYVDGADGITGTPAVGGDRAGGTKASPTAVVDGMGLSRFIGAGYDGTAISGTRAQILLRAAGNWSGSSHPTKIELYTTPSGSTTRAIALTIGSDGNVNIESGKTYNIAGSPHTHAHNDATSLQGGTAGEYFHLTSADNTEAVAFLNGGTSTHTAVDAGLVTNGNTHDHSGGDGNPIAGIVVPYTNTANLYRHANPTATTRFNALINGTPTNAANSVVTFDTVTNGNVTSITPNATGQLAQMRLYNTTRGDYALIVSATGATVTLDRNVRTLANPWADNDSITNYQTTIGTGGVAYAELEIIDATLLGKSALIMEVSCRSATAGELFSLHPYTAYASSKEQSTTALIGGGAPLTTTRTVIMPLTSNVIGIGWQGTAYTALIIKVEGYVP